MNALMLMRMGIAIYEYWVKMMNLMHNLIQRAKMMLRNKEYCHENNTRNAARVITMYCYSFW